MEGSKTLSDRFGINPMKDTKDPKELITVTTCCPKEDGSMECVTSVSGVTTCNDETKDFFKCLFNSDTMGAECQDKLAKLDSCIDKNGGLTG